MAKDKNSFTAYCDWGETFDLLSNEDAGKLAKLIFDYVRDKDPEPENQIIKLAFAPIKSTLKRDLKKWRNKVETNRANARKRWDAKNATASDRMPTDATALSRNANYADRDRDSDSDSVNDKVSVKEKREKAKLDFKNEIKPFIKEGKISVEEARKFYDYWTEHGPRDRKLRFQKEKSFALSRRINTWVDNAEKWAAKNSGGKLTLTEGDLTDESF